MGSVFGAVSAFASLGMALGPLAGGWVFDTFHTYNWLYVGSFGIGIAAVAVALSFLGEAAVAALARSRARGGMSDVQCASRPVLIGGGGSATIAPRAKQNNTMRGNA